MATGGQVSLTLPGIAAGEGFFMPGRPESSRTADPRSGLAVRDDSGGFRVAVSTTSATKSTSVDFSDISVGEFSPCPA